MQLCEVIHRKDKPQCPEPMGVRTRTDHIPPMPSLVPAELSQWLLDRQSDLQETLELGGPADLVLQLTSMLSDGVVRDRVEWRNGSVTTRSGNLCGDKQCELRRQTV